VDVVPRVAGVLRVDGALRVVLRPLVVALPLAVRVLAVLGGVVDFSSRNTAALGNGAEDMTVSPCRL
jgi:hypothetical protein